MDFSRFDIMGVVLLTCIMKTEHISACGSKHLKVGLGQRMQAGSYRTVDSEACITGTSGPPLNASELHIQRMGQNSPYPAAAAHRLDFSASPRLLSWLLILSRPF